MSDLLPKDWKNILGIVYRMNAAESIVDMQAITLEGLRCSIPFHQGIFHVYQKGDDGFSLYNEPYVVGAKALYLDEFNRKYLNTDFFNVGKLVSCDEVIRDTDLFPDKERMQTDWYREIYAKQGIHYAMRCQLTRNKTLIGSIDLFRQIDDADFSDREMHIMETLSRHLSQKLSQLLDATKYQIPSISLQGRLGSRYGLTARECDVVFEIASGALDQDVSKKLCITPSTLKKHVHNIYKKMNIRNRTQLYAVVQDMLHSTPDRK